MRTKPSSFILLCLLLGFSIQAKARPFQTFQEYCDHRGQLTTADARTIQAVLDNLYVTALPGGATSPVPWHCADAAQRLARLKKLTLLDRSNTFLPHVEVVDSLEPLATLVGIEDLTIGGKIQEPGRIFDVSPLAQISSLKKLTLTFGHIAHAEKLAALTHLKELQIAARNLPSLVDFGSLATLHVDAGSGDETSLALLASLPVNVETLTITGSRGLATFDLAVLQDKTGLHSLAIDGTKLTRGETLRTLSGLETLDLENIASGTLDATGLARLAHVKIRRSPLTGLETLGAAANITDLVINESGLRSLDFVADLPQLETLDIGGNDIGDIHGVSGLRRLRVFRAAHNHIYGLDDLNGIASLRVLDLSANSLLSLSYLTLTDLTSLDVSANQLYDLRGIEPLKRLETLNLAGNQIYRIAGLSGMTALKSLELAGNRIADISVLAELTALHDLKRLDLSHNKIYTTRGLEAFTKLTDLELWDNSIEDLHSLRGLTSLDHLSLSYNNITDVSDLTTLTHLTYLDLGQNRITDVRPLATLTNLRYLLNLGDNSITDASPLKALAKQSFRLVLTGNPLIDQTCPIQSYCEF